MGFSVYCAVADVLSTLKGLHMESLASVWHDIVLSTIIIIVGCQYSNLTLRFESVLESY
jgi:hypothetical protein